MCRHLWKWSIEAKSSDIVSHFWFLEPLIKCSENEILLCVAIGHSTPFKSFERTVWPLTNARRAKRSLYDVMVTGPIAMGRGGGGLGQGRIDCMSPVNRKYTSYYSFHINDHSSVFFRLSNDFCDPLSGHQFQNIPHPDREKLRISVPRGWFHPASRF